MGLAATQARLLTITARKADCEFQSMTLSHQKLALARDMENVSSEYQNALSQTKLVYDYYGTGDTSIDLDYGLLMTPSIYNDYYPKTVTDAENKVILNSSYAAAARAAGIPVEGLEGTPSSTVRNNFIEALAEAGVITPARAAAIESVTYANTMGVGSTTSATTAVTDITYDELIDLIKINCEDTNTAGCNIASSTSLQMDGKYQRLCTILEDGTYKDVGGSNSPAQTITLEDLLTGDTQYAIAYESKEGKHDGHDPTETLAELQQVMVNDDSQTSILTWIDDQFTSILGGISANDTALQYAYNAVYDILYPSNSLVDNANSSSIQYNGTLLAEHGTKVLKTKAGYNGFDKDVPKASSNNIGMVYSQTKTQKGFHTRKNDNATVAVNLNNIAQVYLTAYVDYMTGLEEGYEYSKGELANSTLYNGEDSDFTFQIATQTEVDSDDDNLYANFYDALFNQICLNGWTENAQIEDTDYLTDLFKNGLAYISSIAEDGYYYQGSYSTDRAVLEVSDESAIAVAEAKYNTEKTKIENKEDTIDLKMKNLDTEITSLTTEYDSTKQIISKSVEKSFKRYEA